MSIFYQLTVALKQMHECQIIHRDLKSANVLVTEDLSCVKITDMNVSKVMKKDFAKTQTGTPFYASPEIWKEQPYNQSTDIWSLGCLLFEICMMTPPFEAKNLDELYEKVSNRRLKEFDSLYSVELQKCIMKLLNLNPEKRPSCEEILAFSIFSGFPRVEKFEDELLKTLTGGNFYKKNSLEFPPSRYSLDMTETPQMNFRRKCKPSKEKLGEQLLLKISENLSNQRRIKGTSLEPKQNSQKNIFEVILAKKGSKEKLYAPKQHVRSSKSLKNTQDKSQNKFVSVQEIGARLQNQKNLLRRQSNKASGGLYNKQQQPVVLLKSRKERLLSNKSNLVGQSQHIPQSKSLIKRVQTQVGLDQTRQRKYRAMQDIINRAWSCRKKQTNIIGSLEIF